MSDKKRLDNLDLLKAIGIVMVLSLHVPLLICDFFERNSAGRIIQYALRLVAEGVPLFVMVNGLLLLKKSDFVFEKHMRKVLDLFRVFLVWAVIYIVLNSFLQIPFERLSVVSFLKYIFYTNVGSQYTGVLWFLQNLLGVYLLFPIIHRVYYNDFKLYSYFFLIVSIYTVGIDTLELIRDFIFACQLDVEAMNGLLYFLQRYNTFGDAWYLFYFMLGGMIYHYSSKIIEKRKVFIAIGFLSWGLAFAYGLSVSYMQGFVYNVAFNYGSIFMAFFLIGLYALTYNFTNDGKIVERFVSSVGKNSMGIYLTHFIPILLVYKAVNIDIDNTLIRVIFYVGVLISSHLLSLLLRKNSKIAKILFN